ncbi:MAG: tetratricopeptide repeat protein [Clostridia bacterium]|nr:tetratricopeptide repeat protein [Clostridia bacterium]
MKTKLITLRNLYKVITEADYPMPSLAVINKRNKTGLIQTAFWTGICLPEFQQGQIGKMLWRTTGNRNRYFSNMCNRLLPDSIYRQYSDEILLSLKPKLIGVQARKIYTFLQSHNYRQQILKERLKYLIHAAETEEETGNGIVRDFFNGLIGQVDSPRFSDSAREAFLLCVILTWLFIYALTAPEFSEILEQLKGKQALFEPDRLMTTKTGTATAKKKGSSVEFLGTLHQLTGGGLPSRQFYGHDSEILDLQEAVSDREKIIISGIGGIGKTEITRQVLKICFQKKTVNKICLVEYNGSLRVSFKNALSAYDRSTDEDDERVRILGYLADHLGEEGLLVIDNMDTLNEDDREWLDRILQAEYAVIITTRMNSVNGFRTIRLNETKPDDCLLIYRNNLGEKVSQPDKKLFMDLMNDPLFCHPLTVLLICKGIRQRRFTLEQIMTELRNESGELSDINDDLNECLVSMYRHLYDMCQLSAADKELAEFFALLPLGNYDTEWLERYAPTGEKTVEAALKLVETGYLNDTGNGYTMHTLIKQCLRSNRISDRHLTALLKPLIVQTGRVYDQINLNSEYSPELQKTWNRDSFVLSDMLPFILRRSNDPELLKPLTDMKIFIKSMFFARQEKTRLRDTVEKAVRKTVTEPLLADTYMLIYDTTLNNADETARIGEHYHLLLESGLDLSDPIILDFLTICGCSSYSSPELSVQMLRTAREHTADKNDFDLQYYLFFFYLSVGDFENASQIGESLHRRLDSQPVTDALFAATGLLTRYVAVKDDERAMSLVSFIEKKLKSDILNPAYRDLFRNELVIHRAMLNVNMGAYEEALQGFLEGEKYIVTYFGKRHEKYPGILSNIAQTYARLRNYDAAEAYYQRAIDSDQGTLSILAKVVMLNNYSVMLLETNKPAEAIGVLNQCLEILIDETAISAEPYRNLARAYDMLGDRETAFKYWEKAYPLLVSLYGEDHERTREARQRVALQVNP